jgi:hypothetical protein
MISGSVSKFSAWTSQTKLWSFSKEGRYVNAKAPRVFDIGFKNYSIPRNGEEDGVSYFERLSRNFVDCEIEVDQYFEVKDVQWVTYNTALGYTTSRSRLKGVLALHEGNY